MWRVFALLFSSHFLLASGSAVAAGEVLTLEEALGRALAKNPGVENAGLDIEKVGDQVSATRTQQYLWVPKSHAALRM